MKRQLKLEVIRTQAWALVEKMQTYSRHLEGLRTAGNLEIVYLVPPTLHALR